MSWDGAVRLVRGGTTPWEGNGQVKFTNDVRCASMATFSRTCQSVPGLRQTPDRGLKHALYGSVF